VGVSRLVRALGRNVAETANDADDARLRTRDYTIPFDDVWYAALLVAGSLPGWKILRADDREGRITAEARTRRLGFVDDVSVRIWLDRNAQTHADMRSASRHGILDFGSNVRRIEAFFDALDEQLERWGKDGAAPDPH
jgi:uncharacterized protein (DUF1499 family)